jgi:hypothetical protein
MGRCSGSLRRLTACVDRAANCGTGGIRTDRLTAELGEHAATIGPTTHTTGTVLARPVLARTTTARISGSRAGGTTVIARIHVDMRARHARCSEGSTGRLTIGTTDRTLETRRCKPTATSLTILARLALL